MNSLNRISYNIAEIVGKANDLSVVLRIQDLIINYRALFVRRTMSNHEKASSHFKQTISPIKMIPVDISETAYLTGNTIYRSTKKIPSTIRMESGESLLYVGSVDGLSPFNEINNRVVGLSNYNKFSNKLVKYYVNDYIYVLNSNPEYIKVIGVFEDPRVVEGFNPDGNFPMSDDMTALIIQTILKEEFRIDSSITEEIKG